MVLTIPEIRIGVFNVELFTQPFQGSHPGHSQVAVLKDDPSSVFLGFLDHLGGDRTLTLTQGYGVELVSAEAFVTGKLQKTCNMRMVLFTSFHPYS